MKTPEIPYCATKYKAEKLAREKGLLNAREKINCQFFASVCNGLLCILEKQEPTTRRINIHQTGVTSIPSGQDRFYRRLKKHCKK